MSKDRRSPVRGIHLAAIACLLAGLAFGVLPSLVARANSAIIYVDDSATGANDGSTWPDAYTDLQDALQDASSGDQIWVAKGLYKPTTGTERTASFRLKSGVRLYGGFAGTESSLDRRNWQNNETILGGDIDIQDDNIDNCYHVVTSSGTDSSAVIDGFTVTCGNADTGGTYRGGGMYNDNSSPTVTNCTFSDNYARSGGGMYNYESSSPMVTNCTFFGNEAEYGGGMDNTGGGPTVTDCTFSGNSASENGGGMHNWNGSPIVTHSTFSGNEARYGGGMHNRNGSPTMGNCVFSGNEASYGGGMCNDNSSPTVTDCTFSDNSADSVGGGMYNWMYDYGSGPTVTHCTFSGNSARHGGGMYNCYRNRSLTVTDCTFSGNEADSGGGMYNDSSSPTVTNCTFSGNSASFGGGMYNDNSSPTVKNTILAGNSPNDCNGSVTSDGYNVERGTSCGCDEPTDQQNTDPLLGPLGDNGGPTETHALLPGSPALDAIPWPGAPTTDQRGFPRPYPLGGYADIGAVEMQRAYSRGDVNGDGSIDLLDVVKCAQIAAGANATFEQRFAADMDRDGDVDADDVTILSELVLAGGGAL